ncbi:hypothetical protein [Bifidobacterium criceti]|uniref:WXG100 family type VII secretion target n=1 Tax=Bifidobacterium criceti TaxID=1960969 RepID=A0A2A2EJ19_9BIFI|nr:hypothetical protein [Bifidobacterium criceti]PAU68908.1 hypothetical protein B1526_0101 [Bifidobacterium criceti]
MTSPALSTNVLTARGTQVATGSSTLRKLVGDAKTVSELNERIQSGIQLGGAIISAVDGIFEGLFGYSPIDEWIKKPFSGDWDAMTTTAERWDALAANLTQTASAITAVSNAVGDGTSWSGNASNEFKKDNDVLAKAMQAGVAPCQEGAEGMRKLAKLAEDTFDFIMSTLQEIANLLASVLADISIPVIGYFKGAWDTHKAIDAVTNLITTVSDRLQQMLATARTFANCLAHFGTAYDQSMSALSECNLTSGAPLSASTQNMIKGAAFITNPGAGLKDAVSGFGNGLGKFGEKVWDGIEWAGDTLVDGGQLLGNGLFDGAQGVQRALGDAQQWGGNVLYDAGQAVWDWGTDRGQDIRRGWNNVTTGAANFVDDRLSDMFDAFGGHGIADNLDQRSADRTAANDARNEANYRITDQRQENRRESGDAWQKTYNEFYDRGQDAIEDFGDSLQEGINDALDGTRGQRKEESGGAVFGAR